jgi:hypothetical protein
MGLCARPQPGALLDVNVAQVQCQRLFASLEQHSDGGRSVSAHNDTSIAFKFRTALFSENGKTNPLTRFHLYVIVAHSRRSAPRTVSAAYSQVQKETIRLIGQRLVAHEFTGSLQSNERKREAGHNWRGRGLVTSRQALKPRTADLRNSDDPSQ